MPISIKGLLPTTGGVGKLVIKDKWGIYNFSDKHYPCLVYITSGQYMGTHGVSNAWSWRLINKDGSLGREENGYGSFYIPKEKYKIQITIKKVK